MSTQKCKFCSDPISPTATECTRCGAGTPYGLWLEEEQKLSRPVLIKCPACDADISNQAAACPRCGQPLQPEKPQARPPQRSQTPPLRIQKAKTNPLVIGCLALIAVPVACIVLANIISSLGTRNSTNQNSSARQTTVTTASPTATSNQSVNQNSESNVMYAREEAPLYTAPDYKSAKFKRPGAQAPRTVSKYDDVKVLEKTNGWYKIESLGDIAWVPQKYLVPQWTSDMRSQRFDIMVGNLNDLLSNDQKYKSFYERVHIASANDTLEITLYVNDRWHLASADTKLAFIKQVLVFLAGSRALQGVKKENKDLKVVHQSSGRVLATWDELWGPKFY